jgi:hypothetical protein
MIMPSYDPPMLPVSFFWAQALDDGLLVGEFWAKCSMTGPAHCSLNWKENV